MQSIDAITLKKMLDEKQDFLLLDVRERSEHAAGNIGGTLIPMSELMENMASIPPGQTIVFYCQKGIRSVIAIQRLQSKLPGSNLINLSGGMEAWIKRFGPLHP